VIRTALPRVEPAIADLAEVVRETERVLDELFVLTEIYGYRGRGSLSGGALDPEPGDGDLSRSWTYVIRQGDTLASVALQFYGDENQWPLIEKANPELLGTGQFTATDVLDDYIGRTLTVPSDSLLPSSLVPDVWDTPIGVRAFGTDLPDDLQVTTRPDGERELVTLGPLETLLQGLQHRIATRQGTVSDVPDYGSLVPGMIGQTFGVLDEPMNSAKIEEALAQDPRLSSVNRVRVRLDQDLLAVDFEATARNAGTLGPINLTINRQSP
jgi:hypothetical protein